MIIDNNFFPIIFLFQSIRMKWSVATSSIVDSSIFWGYFITQIPGGFLAAKYPPNRLFGAAIGCSSLLHFFVPSAMELQSATLAIAVRVMQGLVEVCYF